jgi:hypothetical protein
LAETADSILEWGEVMGSGKRRGLAEEIGRSGLAGELLDAERRVGDDFDEEMVDRAIA